RLVAARDAYVHGASEERQRIARDLHDDVSGRLMTSLHRSDAAAMRHDVREAMADIRTIVNGLAGEPRTLGELLADVRHESQARLDACGVTLSWTAGQEFEDPRPLDYPVYRHLVSVLRESVSNIVRHAGASRVEVSVQCDDETLSIEIADDGCGIDADVEPGNGLRNCARRAEALGGCFEILPTAAGTVVRFQMCLPGAIAQAAAMGR
ncbi:MAG: sensor histidine kinase, partial [Brevundimonas sp.]